MEIIAVLESIQKNNQQLDIFMICINCPTAVQENNLLLKNVTDENSPVLKFKKLSKSVITH